MDSSEDTMTKLDKEFDQLLAEMKPPVLRLPRKSDRQTCALWIKKFCDPAATGITGRKNRNMYAQLLLHMLKRGHLEEPFTHKPDPGPLKTLPPYMSIYFDDVKGNNPTDRQDKLIPDWVTGELHNEGLSMGSSMTSLRPSTAPERYTSTRPYAAIDTQRRQERSTSPPRARSKDRQMTEMHKDFGALLNSDSDDTDLFQSYKADKKWNKGIGLSSTMATSAVSSTFDQPTALLKSHEKELEMRNKMFEAKLQEEKLRLQQKHDSTVQKILDRKNTEIEDLKAHYRTKTKELEETNTKLERQVGSLSKELQVVQEQKDQQVSELRQIAEENGHTKKTEYDRKIHDVVADFEQEKFDLQKKHTQNIQELLDDTNTRLQKMEDEYSQQASATATVIRELEGRIHQLTSEVETHTIAKNLLEREKADLEYQVEKQTSDINELQTRYASLEQEIDKARKEQDYEMKAMQNKYESKQEITQQEQNIAAAKAVGTISDLEKHIEQLKLRLETSEQEYQHKLRELEQTTHCNKIHQEQLHDTKLRALQKEMDFMEQELQKKVRKAENTIRDKEEQLRRSSENNKQQLEQSQIALEEFKSQVEKNSSKIYDEMKQQMERVSLDLDRSKKLREKQAIEFHKQLETEKCKQEREIQELKFIFEKEKSQIIKENHDNKEHLLCEKEHELECIRDTMKSEMSGIECRSRERQERDTKKISLLEEQICKLREEVIQGNQLRKQQLVELGLLREEEKQKLSREKENQILKLRSQYEQQRLDMERAHSAEHEQNLDKTNGRLKEMENEYTQRNEKAQQMIESLRKTVYDLQEEIARFKDNSEQQLSSVNSRFEDERRKVKRQNNTTIMSLQQEIENQKLKCRSLERNLGLQQQESEEKVNELKKFHEEKMKGLVSSSVRQELEDTISSLKSQVNSLQKRVQILQEDIDIRSKHSTMSSLTGSLTSSTPLPIS